MSDPYQDLRERLVLAIINSLGDDDPLVSVTIGPEHLLVEWINDHD